MPMVRDQNGTNPALLERKWLMTPTENDVIPPVGFTVAGLIRRLAESQPDLEMLVAGEVRRTWSEEYRWACRVAQALA